METTWDHGNGFSTYSTMRVHPKQAIWNESNLVGVTGGIACGKSTVLEILAQLGRATLDTDRVVHDLYENDPQLRTRLAAKWGSHVLDNQGKVDRRAVADIVFENPDELEWLNACIHPLVRRRMKEQAANVTGWLFCAVPLLFEAGWQEDFTWTIAVWCEPKVRLERARRRGWDESELRRREARQMPAETKLERADFGLINNGSRNLLRRQCGLLLAALDRWAPSDRPNSTHPRR